MITLLKRSVALLLSGSLVLVSAPGAFAYQTDQSAAPPPAQAAQQTPEQLQQLVAPMPYIQTRWSHKSWPPRPTLAGIHKVNVHFSATSTSRTAASTVLSTSGSMPERPRTNIEAQLAVGSPSAGHNPSGNFPIFGSRANPSPDRTAA